MITVPRVRETHEALDLHLGDLIDFADSEDTDPRRSHPAVFYIDVNSIPLSIVETFSMNRTLCGIIWEGSAIH
jgi:hypothetical protein